MTTQVIFKIDKNLKDRAMKKAQTEGFPFATVLKLATKAFVDGNFDVGLTFNTKTSKILQRELKEIKTGKNMSPGFKDNKSAVAYLKNL